MTCTVVRGPMCPSLQVSADAVRFLRHDGAPAHLSNLDIRRSASGLPPVWQVGQYCRDESAKAPSPPVPPQPGQAKPVRPCTARLLFFSPLSSAAASPRDRLTASPRTVRIASYRVSRSSPVIEAAGLNGDSFAACSSSSEYAFPMPAMVP